MHARTATERYAGPDGIPFHEETSGIYVVERNPERCVASRAASSDVGSRSVSPFHSAPTQIHSSIVLFALPLLSTTDGQASADWLRSPTLVHSLSHSVVERTRCRVVLTFTFTPLHHRRLPHETHHGVHDSVHAMAYSNVAASSKRLLFRHFLCPAWVHSGWRSWVPELTVAHMRATARPPEHPLVLNQKQVCFDSFL